MATHVLAVVASTPDTTGPEIERQVGALEQVLATQGAHVLEPKYDFMLAPFALFYQPKKLDMDSCIICNEVIDEIAREANLYDEVAAITRQAMHEGLDFDTALRKRVALLKGLPVPVMVERVWQRLELNRGAYRLISTLRRYGIITALLSGGFTLFAHRVGKIMGMDYVFANTLKTQEPTDGSNQDMTLTGEVAPTIVNAKTKAALVRAIAKKQGLAAEGTTTVPHTVAMGDGANDLLMLQTASIGVAFHGKPILKAGTSYHLDHGPLDTLLHFLPLLQLGEEEPQAGQATDEPEGLHELEKRTVEQRHYSSLEEMMNN